MNKRENGTPKIFVLPIIIAAILFISMSDLPYGFYTVMRIVVPLLSGLYLFFAYMDNEEFSLMLIPNILIVIIWNPIIPVYLDKETWIGIDVIAGIVEIIVAIYAYYIWRRS